MNSTKLSRVKKMRNSNLKINSKKNEKNQKKPPDVASRRLEEQIALTFYLFGIKSIFKKTVRNS